MENKNQLQLQVPDPCAQSWVEMTPQGANRHCQSCNKIIYDFSTYTDEELIAYFTHKRTEQVCGRFATEQLDRPLRSHGTWGRWFRALAAFVLPLFIHTRADAQRTTPEAQVDQREPKKVRAGKQPTLLGVMISPDWIENQKPGQPQKADIDPRFTTMRRVKGKVRLPK